VPPLVWHDGSTAVLLKEDDRAFTAREDRQIRYRQREVAYRASLELHDDDLRFI
jgi:hypothetical protein